MTKNMQNGSFEDLPIIPEVWKVQVSEDKKKQFEVLCSLMNREDVAYLVNGCDAGREGELIFKRVYDLADCRKPVKRLWISSMEDEAIQKGFQSLNDGREYAGLCNAAVCRAQADWLIGMNATRAYTTRYFKRLVVGRVQTPTLAMLTERKEKIEHFKKEAYYKVSLSDGKLTVTSESIPSEMDAEELRKLCDGTEALVTRVKREQKKTFPPKLYDLTSLQREANRFFGYTAQKTLDMLQELYEEKMVTYPRTDSQYVTEDMKETVKMLAEGMADFLPFLEFGQIMGNINLTDLLSVSTEKEKEKAVGKLSGNLWRRILYLQWRQLRRKETKWKNNSTCCMERCLGCLHLLFYSVF